MGKSPVWGGSIGRVTLCLSGQRGGPLESVGRGNACVREVSKINVWMTAPNRRRGFNDTTRSRTRAGAVRASISLRSVMRINKRVKEIKYCKGRRKHRLAM